MNFLSILMIGIGLSMDAFAAAVCKGLNMNRINYKNTFIIALFFGGFQAAMPIIGWLLGKRFEVYITSIDHWIAFFILIFIGGKMIIEAVKSEEYERGEEGLDIKELLILAIATSIDALAVGITFAFLGYDIIKSSAIIGITTYILSVFGVIIGNKFGCKYKNKAEFAGGAILVIIGSKILIEHLIGL